MTIPGSPLPADVLRHSAVRLEVGPGALARLGELLCREPGRAPEQRVLLVSDPGVARAGHADAALESMSSRRVRATLFERVPENPTTATVADGLNVARICRPTCIIGLGGGSAMDAAKGINLLYSNGGDLAEYRGDPGPEILATRKPLLPMILIPTTAGTGSEAQSFALISAADTHEKMACGDRRAPTAGGLRPRIAILDPALTATTPRAVAAAAGIDAVAHAVETAGCTRRSPASRDLSRQAWKLLSGALVAALQNDGSRASAAALAARTEMLLGAHLAGCAIELSMLGAVHACANPLTARFGITHGVAVGVMLPHVIRFNAGIGQNPYSDLDEDADRLAARVERLIGAARIPGSLSALGVPRSAVPQLAEAAARQWTASFNPRPVTSDELAAVYRCAFGS